MDYQHAFSTSFVYIELQSDTLNNNNDVSICLPLCAFLLISQT